MAEGDLALERPEVSGILRRLENAFAGLAPNSEIEGLVREWRDDVVRRNPNLTQAQLYAESLAMLEAVQRGGARGRGEDLSRG